MNFRFGQVFLLVSVILILRRGPIIDFFKENRAISGALGFLIVQCAVLPVRTHPGQTILKLLWISFNLGLVSYVFWCGRTRNWRKFLLEAVTAAISFNALVMIVDWTAIYGFSSEVLIGSVQTSYANFVRPHAFYYEPSYVAAVLSLGAFLPLLVVRSEWIGVLLAAINILGLYISSSRTGYLQFLALIVAAIVFCRFEKEWMCRIWKATAAGMLLALSTCLFQGGRDYFDFQVNNLGWGATLTRLTRDYQTGTVTSESNRVRVAKLGLQKWTNAPLLGNGFIVWPEQTKIVEPFTMNTYVELLSEFGLFGIIVFFMFIRMFYQRAESAFGRAMIVAHCLVNLNFTQNVPRLDYWMLIAVASMALDDSRNSFAKAEL
ncbi:MAG: O-antigen ligase family protein [Bdellovibrionales bacterium]|nr:O-antigen ligase family protein [Bdellovibrionales bacterium]